MGQPYGRSQARGKNSHVSRQPPTGNPAQHIKKHFVKPAPPREPAQTASVIKTRAFKLLVNAVGAENLALALDSNLARIAELENGERFTAETAFHMEATLGLPHGFFDQPYPVLTPEVTARLRSPLEILLYDDIAEEGGDRSDQNALVSSTAYTTPTEVPLTRDNEMATNEPKAAITPPSTKKGGSTDSGNRAQKRNGPNGTKVAKPTKAELQHSLELAAEPSVPEIRRANLHMLTARNGSKALLSRLLNLSQSNIAHRLHGKKRLDDAESERITNVLDLPSGWLDTPRETVDVPAAVADKLAPPTRHRSKSPSTSDLQNASSHNTAEDTAQDSDQPDRALVKEESAEPEAQSDLADAVSGALASNNETTSRPETVPAIPVATHVYAEITYPSTAMTDLDTLRGIAPIAEALLKTLAEKARIGRLDEGTALKLLQQIVSL
jgi:hypothetical protein